MIEGKGERVQRLELRISYISDVWIGIVFPKSKEPEADCIEMS